MRSECQEYKDVTYEEAVSSGCDVVQLKYDGWWTRNVLQNNTCQTFSKTQRLINEFNYDFSDSTCIVAEYMHGTQWAQDPVRKGRYYIFDCWYTADTNLSGIPYRDRYALLKNLHKSGRLPERFELVANYPISSYPSLWDQYVLNGDYEGVVFRKSTAPVGILHRHKLTITRNLKAIGFIAGLGKHEGRLGAIIGLTEEGVSVDIGGGFSDADREHIWANKNLYSNQWFEVEARKEFDSGSLRHPNFLRWRTDLS